MTSSNATLASLWVEDGSGHSSPMRILSGTSKVGVTAGNTLRDDIVAWYRDTGLEPVAKEAGILDSDGQYTTIKDHIYTPKTVQMIAVPMSNHSPAKTMTTVLAKSVTMNSPGSPVILSTPQKCVNTTQYIGTPQRVYLSTASPRNVQPHIMTTPIQMLDSPQWSARKRSGGMDIEYSDGKRKKNGSVDKGGKGLRHFSMKVCEKVQRKGITSYNEVADELVSEFSDPRTLSPTDQSYDQKNIRRRVYDALNVLMAMNIISKEKKEIRWIGLPTNSAQECQNLETEKQRRLERIKHKTQQLQELILQQIAFKNLVERNRSNEQMYGPPPHNSAIQLPFIIVNTNKKTVIDCSISNDKYEYLFNFDNTFEIHDDIEVLKRMGMAFGLEKKECSQSSLSKAVKMVPKSLGSYVIEMANCGSSQEISLGTITTHPSTDTSNLFTEIKQEPLAMPILPLSSYGDHTMDNDISAATARALSRQSSFASFSDSEESDSERSSPVDIS